MSALEFPSNAQIGTIWPQEGVARWRYAGNLVWRAMIYAPPQDAGIVPQGVSPPVNGTTTAQFLGQIYIQNSSEAYICVRMSPSSWKKITGAPTDVPATAILYNGEPILYNGEPILYTPTT